MKKHLLLISAIAAIVLAVVASALVYLTRDEPPGNFADLMPATHRA